MLLEPIVQLLSNVSNVDEICIPSKHVADKYRLLLKELYDRSWATSRKRIGPLSSLAIDGIDDESIWEELQTRDNPLLKFVTKAVKRMKKLQLPKNSEEQITNEPEEYEANDDNSLHEGDSTYSEEDLVEHSDASSESVDDDEEFEESCYDESNHDMSNESFEDDNERMESWLDKEDEFEMNRQYKEEQNQDKSEDGEEHDDLKFVQENLYDLSDDEDDDGTADYKFSDFFIVNHDQVKKSLSKDRTTTSGSNTDSYDESDIEVGDNQDNDKLGAYGSVSEEEMEDCEVGNSQSANKLESKHGVNIDFTSTSFSQRRNHMLVSQISTLEEELVTSKPWELRGEVKAGDRPENSFLGLHADIERTSKPAPVVTQAFTTSMEEMIRRRIKEGNFSDVLPPAPEKDTERENSDEQELSQEKNKLGLGEVYAEDFLAKSLNAQPEAVSKRLEQDRIDAQEIFHKISRQLDALSHFHFSPRPVVADTKLQTLQPTASTTSSLLLEDITPVTAHAVSNSQLAPEQVLAKKLGKDASLKAAEELTSVDRKRTRRASKASNKAMKARVRDEVATTGKPDSSDTTRAREESKALDEQLKRDSRVLLTTSTNPNKKAKGAGAIQAVDPGRVSFSKSASFFSKLQQDTSNYDNATKEKKFPVVNPFVASNLKL